MTSRRRSPMRAKVPSSSRSISAEKPTTSAAKMAARRLVVIFQTALRQPSKPQYWLSDQRITARGSVPRLKWNFLRRHRRQGINGTLISLGHRSALQIGNEKACGGAIQLSYGCVAVHLADWPGLGNDPAGAGQGLRARPERQRSHVRIVSGASEKHVPGVLGLWRAQLPESRPNATATAMRRLPTLSGAGRLTTSAREAFPRRESPSARERTACGSFPS